MGSLSARGHKAAPSDWKFYSKVSLFVMGSVMTYGVIIWLTLR